MNKALKTKWIKALRSGQYEQGGGRLRDEYNNFCCLGVLHDVSGGRWFRTRSDGDSGFSVGKMRYDAFLPPRLACGLTQDQQDELANLNDSGESFLAIAKYIEKNIPVTK